MYAGPVILAAVIILLSTAEAMSGARRMLAETTMPFTRSSKVAGFSRGSDFTWSTSRKISGLLPLQAGAMTGRVKDP